MYSNFWIGAGAALLTSEFYLVNELPIDFEVVSFAFFATVLTYTFQRSIKLLHNSQQGSSQLKWMKKNNLLVKAILLFSTVATIRHLFYFTVAVDLLLIFSGLLSMFYIVKIPGKWGTNLRDVPSLKIFLIAIVWALTTSFLPYLNLNQKEIDLPWLLFFANFMLIIALTIPFDIRDIQLDEPEKKTIPQLLGERKAIYLAVALLVMYWPILCLIASQFLFLSFVGVSLTIVLINGSKKSANDFYFSFAIDGLLILLPLLLWAETSFL